jgi:hypothetical protein
MGVANLPKAGPMMLATDTKVDVEGSNPFSRSTFSRGNRARSEEPADLETIGRP